jgi:hypothetical protein
LSRLHGGLRRNHKFTSRVVIADETDVNVKMSGDGPMAGLMGRMGNISMTTVVESIDVAPAADDLLAAYKLSPKK